MDNRILMAGAAVLVVGAAFGGGYYVNHQPAPIPAPAPVEAPVSPSAPAQVAEQPAETPAAPAAAPVTESAPTPTVAAQPTIKKRRLPDYAGGETAYAPPPPPPPPPPLDFRGPNPFEEHFATFPMHHSGSGTLASPLTWTAQTEIGHGHEADLRVSVVVPMPAPGDNGVFWSKWSSRGSDDVMPQITRGTPVVVAASASVVLAIDPEFIDLDAPAVLSINGRDGQRVYRSRDVAPARGESWNAQGTRWIFQPDADFFRLMQRGADVSVSFRSRMSGNPITVPFATDDFPPSLNGFQRDLYARMPGIAAAWDRARPGAPPPPRQVSNPPPNYPPQPNGPPPRVPMPPQYGPQPPNGPQPQSGPQGGNGYGHGDHGHDHGATNETPVQPMAPKPVTPPTPAQPTQPAQTAPQAGNGHDHGDHAHDHGGANQTSVPPAGPKPNTPPAAMTPPAKPATPPPVKVVPALPPAPAANPGVTMLKAEVAAYRPPTDNCGPQPPVPQQRGSSPERKQSNIWLQCRNQWMNAYKKSINMLNRDASKQGAALEGVSGGSAIIANFEKAQSELSAQKASIKP